MIPLLSGLIILVGLTVMSLALGRRLLIILFPARKEISADAFVTACIGLGALQFLPFLLFALRIGTPLIIRASLGVLAVALLPDAITIMQRWIEQVRCWRPKWGIEIVGGAALAVMLLVLFVRALVPESLGDPIYYHLNAPLRYLQAGHFILLPTFTYTNWPMGQQMLFGLLLAVSPTAPCSVVSFLLGCVTLGILWRLANVIGGYWTAIAAIPLVIIIDGVSRHGFWFQMAHSYIDVGLTCFTTCAFYALLRTVRSSDPSERETWSGLTAIAGGLAATVKMTGIWVIAACCGVIVLESLWNRRGSSVWPALRIGVIAGAIVTPWFIKTWALTGNPFFPMLYGVFGGREWTAEGMAAFLRAHYMWNTPPGVQPTLPALSRVHSVIAATGSIAAALVVWVARKSAVRSLVWGCALFIGCVLCTNYLHPRFLLPMLPTIAALILYGLRRWQKPVAIGACVIASLIGAIGVVRLEPEFFTAARLAVGKESRDHFLRREIVEYSLIDFANSHIPVESKIIIGGYDAKPMFYRAQALVADWGVQDSVHFDSQTRLLADLRRLKVRYLVLNPDYPDWCDTSFACKIRRDTERQPLIDLAVRYGVELYRIDRFALYRLDYPED